MKNLILLVVLMSAKLALALPPDVKISDVMEGAYQMVPAGGQMDTKCGLHVMADPIAKAITVTVVSNPVSLVYCEYEDQSIRLTCPADSVKSGCYLKGANARFFLEHDSLWKYVENAEIYFLPNGNFSLTLQKVGSKSTETFAFKYYSANILNPIYFRGNCRGTDGDRSYKENCAVAYACAWSLAQRGCDLYGYNCQEYGKTVSPDPGGEATYCTVNLFLKAK